MTKKFLNTKIELKPGQTLLEFLLENKDNFFDYTSVLIEDEREFEKYNVSIIKNPYTYGELYDEKEYGKLLTTKDGKYQMRVIRIYHGEEYGIPRAKYYVENINSIVNYQRMIFGDETSGNHYGVRLPDELEYTDYIKQHIDEISKNSLQVNKKIIEDPTKYIFVRKENGTKGESFNIYTPNNDKKDKRFISILNTTKYYDPDVRYVTEVIEKLSISTKLFNGGFPYRNNPKITLDDSKISTSADVM